MESTGMEAGVERIGTELIAGARQSVSSEEHSEPEDGSQG